MYDNTLIITEYYGEMPVLFQTNAFINATAIAKQFNKQPSGYLKSDRTKEYMQAIKRNSLIEQNQLITIKNGAPETGGGTWLHPKLAIDFARWLSADFAVWCDLQIEKILHNKVTECFDGLADNLVPSHPKSQAPAFEHDPERVVLIREIATLTKRLVRCRNPMERQALGRCVMHLNEMAGFADHLNPLVLAELALVPLRIAADSDNGLILKQFWQHYRIIEALEPLNHTSKPGFIALNLAYVLKAFQRESLDHDVDKGRLYDALRASASPYPEFVKASFNLQSVLLPKQVVRTWLFKANSEGALS